MKRKLLVISAAAIPAFLLSCCNSSRRLYHPPALGAEYQFDRGLPADKHPKQLFDPRMEESLKKQGQTVPSGGSGAAATTAVQKGNPVSSDSSHTAQH